MRIPVLFCAALVSVATLAAETAPRTAQSHRLPLQDGSGASGVSSGRPVPAGGFSKYVPRNLYQPRRPPEQLGLGTVSSEGVAPCGEGFPEGAQCTRLSVECPGLPMGEVIVAVTEPAAPAEAATVILHNGSGGTTVFDNGFPAALLARGIRVVQMVWVTDWPYPVGTKTSACRPSSVFQWLFDNVHGGDRTRGFCGFGHSGGSAAMAYAISFYGLDGIFDFVLMNSGPPLGRIDYGCEPSLYPGGPRFVCPSIPDAPYAYEVIRADEIDLVEGTATCGDPHGDSSDAEREKWTADSVVSPGGGYDYPDTTLSFYFCANSPNSAVGLASFYIDQVLSSKSVHCVGGQCVGEGTWRDPDAFERMIDDIAAGCVPNHFTPE